MSTGLSSTCSRPWSTWLSWALWHFWLAIECWPNRQSRGEAGDGPSSRVGKRCLCGHCQPSSETTKLCGRMIDILRGKSDTFMQPIRETISRSFKEESNLSHQLSYTLEKGGGSCVMSTKVCYISGVEMLTCWLCENPSSCPVLLLWPQSGTSGALGGARALPPTHRFMFCPSAVL